MAKEGDKIEVSCVMENLGVFDMLTLAYRAKENGAKKARSFSENTELAGVYEGREEYGVRFNTIDDSVTAVFQSRWEWVDLEDLKSGVEELIVGIRDFQV